MQGKATVSEQLIQELVEHGIKDAIDGGVTAGVVAAVEFGAHFLTEGHLPWSYIGYILSAILGGAAAQAIFNSALEAIKNRGASSEVVLEHEHDEPPTAWEVLKEHILEYCVQNAITGAVINYIIASLSFAVHFVNEGTMPASALWFFFGGAAGGAITQPIVSAVTEAVKAPVAGLWKTVGVLCGFKRNFYEAVPSPAA